MTSQWRVRVAHWLLRKSKDWVMVGLSGPVKDVCAFDIDGVTFTRRDLMPKSDAVTKHAVTPEAINAFNAQVEAFKATVRDINGCKPVDASAHPYDVYMAERADATAQVIADMAKSRVMHKRPAHIRGTDYPPKVEQW